MARVNNPVLGSIQCDGCKKHEATVHQASRGKGRFLYTRCPECGADQRNGKAVQTRLWEGTNWRPGMKPETPPPNVNPPDDWQPGQPPPAAKAAPEQPKPEPEQPEKTTGAKGAGKRLATGLAGFGLVVATGVGVWLKTRMNTR